MPKISVLRYHRKKRNLTLHQLSDSLDIPVSAIKEWEMLRRHINIDVSTELSEFFDEPTISFVGKKTIEISVTEYHTLHRVKTIYFPNELKVQDKYKKLIDAFLYSRRPIRLHL